MSPKKRLKTEGISRRKVSHQEPFCRQTFVLDEEEPETLTAKRQLDEQSLQLNEHLLSTQQNKLNILSSWKDQQQHDLWPIKQISRPKMVKRQSKMYKKATNAHRRQYSADTQNKTKTSLSIQNIEAVGESDFAKIENRPCLGKERRDNLIRKLEMSETKDKIFKPYGDDTTDANRNSITSVYNKLLHKNAAKQLKTINLELTMKPDVKRTVKFASDKKLERHHFSETKSFSNSYRKNRSQNSHKSMKKPQIESVKILRSGLPKGQKTSLLHQQLSKLALLLKQEAQNVFRRKFHHSLYRKKNQRF